MNNVLILYVEDNDVNRDALGIILQRQGFDVTTAINGEEGVAAAKSRQPDIILMDIRMPVMNGIEATEILKNDPVTSHIPILVITAYSRGEGNRKGCLEAGCDEYLLKPVETSTLVDTINKHLH